MPRRNRNRNKKNCSRCGTAISWGDTFREATLSDLGKPNVDFEETQNFIKKHNENAAKTPGIPTIRMETETTENGVVFTNYIYEESGPTPKNQAMADKIMEYSYLFYIDEEEDVFELNQHMTYQQTKELLLKGIFLYQELILSYPIQQTIMKEANELFIKYLLRKPMIPLPARRPLQDLQEYHDRFIKNGFSKDKKIRLEIRRKSNEIAEQYIDSLNPLSEDMVEIDLPEYRETLKLIWRLLMDDGLRVLLNCHRIQGSYFIFYFTLSFGSAKRPNKK